MCSRGLLCLVRLRMLQVTLFQRSTGSHLGRWIDFFNPIGQVLLYILICGSICHLLDEDLYLVVFLLAVGAGLLRGLSGLCDICLLVPQRFQVLGVRALLYQLEVHFANCSSCVILIF